MCIRDSNWTEPLLPPFSGPFSEDFAPLEEEILDQWQERDGTRNVVIRTPSGHTLCGRLEAWNPLNPLLEPIAMYRLCAGGGRRKPTQKLPEPKDWQFSPEDRAS